MERSSEVIDAVHHMVLGLEAQGVAAAPQPKTTGPLGKPKGRGGKKNPRPPSNAKSSRVRLERGEAETSQVATSTPGTVVVRATTTATKAYAVGAPAPAAPEGAGAAGPGWADTTRQWGGGPGPCLAGPHPAPRKRHL